MEDNRNRIKNLLRGFRITTDISLVVFIGFLIAGGKWVCRSTIDPHIEVIAAQLDIMNHIPIIKEMAEIRTEAKSNDTTLKIIKSILEVMATNDQLIEAKTKRDGKLWR